mgnify:CR=1 FL=1
MRKDAERVLIKRRAPFVVAQKPPGMPDGPDLVDALMAEGGFRQPPRLCHRLEPEVSGVMLLATSVKAEQAAVREFASRRVRTSYVALCAGRMESKQLVEVPLALENGRLTPRPDGARYRTLCVPLWCGPGLSVVLARPSSTRAEQVRTHLAAAGHAVLGDQQHGAPGDCRPMLHLCRIMLRCLEHDLTLDAQVWPDLAAILRQLGAPVPRAKDVDDALSGVVRELDL